MNKKSEQQEKEDDSRLEAIHQKELYTQIYDESSNIDNFFKKSISNPSIKKADSGIEIPDIKSKEETATDLATPEVQPLEGKTPSLTGDLDSPEAISKLDQILKELNDVSLNVKLENLKQDILSEVTEVIREVKKEIEEFKDKKVPKRKYFDTGSVYKEELYNLATKVLDNVLIDLFEELPDYSLLANQITKVFDDGTAANGIISINVTVNKDGYRYDFKVDVPLLNGILSSPLYLQRGNKIIPLSQDAIYEELESIAFRKINIDDMTSKKNVYNNIGENILKRNDHQKQYHVNENIVSQNNFSEDTKWINEKTKGYR